MYYVLLLSSYIYEFFYCLKLWNAFLWTYTGIVVTNDGNAILRELDVAHPAAKAQSLFPFYYEALSSFKWFESFIIWMRRGRLFELVIILYFIYNFKSYTLLNFYVLIAFWHMCFFMVTVDDWTKPNSGWRGRRWDNICDSPWYALELSCNLFICLWYFMHTILYL